MIAIVSVDATSFKSIFRTTSNIYDGAFFTKTINSATELKHDFVSNIKILLLNFFHK